MVDKDDGRKPVSIFGGGDNIEGAFYYLSSPKMFFGLGEIYEQKRYQNS